MLNRRSSSMFTVALLIIAGASAQAGPQASPDLGITVHRISPRAAVFNVGPWNNSYLAPATQKGIVVIDSAFSKTVAQAVRASIQAEFKRSDFAFLINSHEHSDHVFGNSAYSDIPIVGSDLLRASILRMKSEPASIAPRLAIPEESLAGTRQELLKDPRLAHDPRVSQSEEFWKVVQADYSAGVEFVPPTITFDHRLSLNLSDVSVNLFSFGHWHSAADTIISIPEEGVIRLGAILYAGQLPVVRNRYANEPFTAAIVDHWIAVLNEVMAQADEKTQFISCHGWTVMSKAQCAPQVAYLGKLWKEVRRAKSAGKTLQQVKEVLSRAQLFAEVAGLTNAADQVPNIHEHNIEELWSVAP
jgi:glyoxylase-like metal-dependent hydrolase (beta-lactamase superfamily II)